VSRYAPIELLHADHELSAFDCGSVAQTDWLRERALQAQQADTARVYVACLAGQKRVVGYYALAAGSVRPEHSPARLIRGAGRYAIPVVLLTRLGVDVSEQGRGLGAALVRDALLQTAWIADRIGVRALLIHAQSEEAAAFYRHLTPEFEPSPTDPLHLILLVKDLRRGIAQAAIARSDERAVTDG
jgi:GNAT superfamily N-acetyltransferase